MYVVSEITAVSMSHTILIFATIINVLIIVFIFQLFLFSITYG